MQLSNKLKHRSENTHLCGRLSVPLVFSPIDLLHELSDPLLLGVCAHKPPPLHDEAFGRTARTPVRLAWDHVSGGCGHVCIYITAGRLQLPSSTCHLYLTAYFSILAFIFFTYFRQQSPYGTERSEKHTFMLEHFSLNMYLHYVVRAVYTQWWNNKVTK